MLSHLLEHVRVAESTGVDEVPLELVLVEGGAGAVEVSRGKAVAELAVQPLDEGYLLGVRMDFAYEAARGEVGP